MMKNLYSVVILSLCFLLNSYVKAQDVEFAGLSWKDNPGDILNQFPGWYNTDEAMRIADNVLLWQRKNGGWPAGKEMVRPEKTDRAEMRKTKGMDDTSIKNGATYTQLQYLARVIEIAPAAKYEKAFTKGLDYLLSAQHDNGGWSLYYPNFFNWSDETAQQNTEGYTRFITFKDSAMIGVVGLLQDIIQQDMRYGFIEEAQRQQVKQALAKGISCILQTQLTTDNRRTGWCARYDEQTLEPRWGRHFEPIAISSNETADIVRFLLDVKQPGPEIIEAVQGAVFWLNEVSMQDMKVMESTGAETQLSAAQPSAAFWANYYEIDTNKPIFANNSTVYYTIAELPGELQTSYKWYGNWADKLLVYDYPRWCDKWSIKNILE